MFTKQEDFVRNLIKEKLNVKNYNAFYHQTDSKSAKTILKNGFSTSEVWAAPDDEGSYGDVNIIVYAPTPKKPFILDINLLLYDTKIPYEDAQKLIAKNYKSLYLLEHLLLLV